MTDCHARTLSLVEVEDTLSTFSDSSKLIACLAAAVISANGLMTGEARGNQMSVANFTQLESATTERNGRIELTVDFINGYLGPLIYCFDGSAERGTDYVSDQDCRSHEVASAAGEPLDQASIVIELLDDGQVEEEETIRVSLRPSKGYRVGGRQQHVVRIRDNDMNWRVMHDVNGIRFDYGFQMLSQAGNTIASAWSDGMSGLPAGIFPVVLTTTDDRFEAIVGPITTAADQTLLGAEIARTFKLVANRPEDEPHINYSQPLLGTATETWTSPDGAAYLSRRNPISGTFLMSRTFADMGPADAHRSGISDETTSQTWMADFYSECETEDLRVSAVKPSAVHEFQIMFGDELPGWTDESRLSGTFGQPFAPQIPYSNFVDDTLSRVRSELYFDKASTRKAKDVAAFRYKALLYKKEEVDAETYIRAQFDEIEDHWDCSARRQAHKAARSVAGALHFAPWNRELRRTLLDIFHDIAVADKAVARQRHAAFAETMLKMPIPGESLIHQEISHLEQAVVLYRHALTDYMQVLHRSLGVVVADVEGDTDLQDASFGYQLFRAEVPFRSPMSASFRNGLGEPMVAGYKDAILLFELLREYLQVAAQLSKRYILRGEPSDSIRAERLIGGALLATWLEGNSLLAILPEIDEPGEATGLSSGVREAVAGWRNSYSALGQVRRYLRGEANFLGFTDDTIVLTQSEVPGGPNTQYFHTYDFLSKEIMDSPAGPLKRAITDLNEARRDYDNFHHRSDQLAQQLHDRNEQYDSRLRDIVGVRPGEEDYDDPANNRGSLISQRLASIESARLRIEKNRQLIENNEQLVRIEIDLRGQVKGINDAISQVYLDFGSEQMELTRKIAQIREDQMNSSNKASVFGSWLGAVAGVVLAPVTSGASLSLTAASVGGFISGGINASQQVGTNIEIGELQAMKERHAAQERAQIQVLQDDLLDANSQARIKTMLQEMSVLALDSREAAIALELEMEQLAALQLEKEDLERRKAESHEMLAARYFADPSHRLLSTASLLRSEYSFAEAQLWMFLTIRAAEYKWNQTFIHESDDGVVSMRALYVARNAHELERLFEALSDWDARLSITGRNDDAYKKLSFREDILGYKYGNSYPGPDGSPLDSTAAFQHYISDAEHYLGPKDPENLMPGFRVLRLRFSTAFVPDSGGLFLRNRWLEKIEHLKVRLLGGAVEGIDSKVDGHLKYGGVSLIRNQSPGTQHPRDPTRWTGEYTAYSTRYWFYRNGRWISKEAFDSAIEIQVSKDSDVPLSSYQINVFKEFSVAASEWTLFVAVENGEGQKLVDLENLTDIEFHIYLRWSVRN